MRIRLLPYNQAEKHVPPEILDPLTASLKCADLDIRPRSAPNLRSNILRRLRELGWTNRVQVAAKSKISITGVNAGVGLCLQLGNMARFYADLLKLQVLFLDHKIKSAIYILPTRSAARILGQNIAHSDRMSQELELYRKIVTIPIVIVEIEGGQPK
jgi:Restriction endonuclease BglII